MRRAGSHRHRSRRAATIGICLWLFCAGTFCAGTWAAIPTQAGPAFVTDQLTVALYAEPDRRAEVIEPALPAGTALKVTNPAPSNGWIRVEVDTGQSGWLPAATVTTNPPTANRLATAAAELDALRVTVAELRQRLGEAPGSGAAVSPAVDLQTINIGLAELRQALVRISERQAGVGSNAELERLRELNAELRTEVETLATELKAARATAGRRETLYGAGLVVFGLLLGVLIKARPRRSAWS